MSWVHITKHNVTGAVLMKRNKLNLSYRARKGRRRVIAVCLTHRISVNAYSNDTFTFNAIRKRNRM